MSALILLLIALPLAGCVAVLALPDRYAVRFGALVAGTHAG